MGVRDWSFARQADSPDARPPGRSPGEGRTFAHLKERLADRYDIELTWDNFDELNKAAANSPLILDYQTRFEDSDLRIFYYQEKAILAFYNTRNHHLNSVLPYSDDRWRLVPMTMRPREAMAASMSLRDRNWLPAHARDNGSTGVQVYRGPASSAAVAKPADPMPWLQPTAEQAAEAKPETKTSVPPLRAPASEEELALAEKTAPPAPTPLPLEAPVAAVPTPPAPTPQTPEARIKELEQLLSWAYFRSLKKGDTELGEAIQKVLMEGV